MPAEDTVICTRGYDHNKSCRGAKMEEALTGDVS